MNGLKRGFAPQEYQERLNRAQDRMATAGLAALLLTTPAEFTYFTGFLTRFWESPTRPWFLVLPASGKPVAVIPSIGAALMDQTWISDIRTWSSPDLEDDGISLLAETLAEIAASGEVGVPDGDETHLRMPLAGFERLREKVHPVSVAGDAGIVRALRTVKSREEIEKIEHACTIAGRAFGRVPEIAAKDMPLEQIFRRFQMLCLEEGADWVPYLAGGAGRDGYHDVISPAGPKKLARGDVMMLDTGLVYDGYFCDYDRNFSIGVASVAAKDGHSLLIEATQAGFEAARPGATASDLYHAMDRLLTGGEGGGSAGRLGHGLGLQLTEWPSLIPDDQTVLEPGMVLTLEPSIETIDGRILVHEENIVITQRGARYLTEPSPPEMLVIG